MPDRRGRPQQLGMGVTVQGHEDMCVGVRGVRPRQSDPPVTRLPGDGRRVWLRTPGRQDLGVGEAVRIGPQGDPQVILARFS